NPATTVSAAIPWPPVDPGANPAAVLIFLSGVYNFRADYSVVVAFEIGSAESGVIGFQTFLPESGKWWISGEVCEAEGLHPDSGVSAGGAAYWLTTMLMLIGYDPAADRVRVAPRPMGHGAGARWEIGQPTASCAAARQRRRRC
ncbi:unnamed protein product, partial [Musa hybrid cultivar]